MKLFQKFHVRGLNVGDRITQVGTGSKKGETTSGSRVDTWEPFIEYAGLVKWDVYGNEGDNLYMAFKLPPEGVTDKKGKPVEKTFYCLYLNYMPGELMRIREKRSICSFFYRATFIYYKP